MRSLSASLILAPLPRLLDRRNWSVPHLNLWRLTMKKLVLTLIAGTVLSSTVLASTDNASDNFTIPHSFNSGETISSSKMNENFQAVKQVIASRKPFKVFSNGTVIGELLGFENANQLVVISEKGFIFNISSEGWTGAPQFSTTTYFETTNCTGDGYQEQISGFLKILHSVYTGLYYIDPSFTQQTIYANSKVSGSNCLQFQGSITGYLISSNEDAVTGVKTQYDTPITIER